jgi:hypothetical protein
MAALGVLILFLHQSHRLKELLILYSVSLLGAPFLLQWLFQGHQQMCWVALTEIVRQIGFAGLVLLTFRLERHCSIFALSNALRWRARPCSAPMSRGSS